VKRIWLLAAIAAGISFGQAAKNNPFSGDPQAAEAGRGVFRVYCSPCHGIKAEGARGPDLTLGVFNAGNGDADLYAVIAAGVPGTEMPAFASRFADDHIWRIVAYIRSVKKESPPPKGDAASGEKLFWGKGACGQCHMVNTRGGRLGPDLSRAGRQRSQAYLRASILTPGAEITPGFATVTVVRKDGGKVTGVQRNLDNYSAQLMDMKENIQSFWRSDVASITREFKSVMPEYANTFSAAELDDVLAYLGGLKGEERKP
jgi:putative heme-binding domain-containing protein